MSSVEIKLKQTLQIHNNNDTNAAVNGHLELTFLKGRQRLDAISMSNLLINFGIGESSAILFLDMVNLHLIIFEAR